MSKQFLTRALPVSSEIIQWIPTSERLPKQGVLILIDTGGAVTTGYLSDDIKRKFLSHFRDVEIRCIAWAELPSGYKP